MLGAAVLAVGVGNVGLLDRVADGLAANADAEQGALAGLELAGERAPAAYQPAPATAPQITAFSYLEAAKDFGSVVPGPVADLPATSRAEADRVLVQLEVRVATPVAPPPPGRPCRVQGPRGELSVGRAGSVLVVAPADQGIDLRLRRFGSAVPPPTVAQVGPGQVARVTIAGDADPRPWLLGTSGPLPGQVCSARG